MVCVGFCEDLCKADHLNIEGHVLYILYPPVSSNMAQENGPFLNDFPNKT